MQSKRIAMLYGGRSGEHEISIRSARSICPVLQNKHAVFPIFIDKSGCWWRVPEGISLPENARSLSEQVFLFPGFSGPALCTSKAKLEIDIAFPVLHGTHGEDGIIQGLLESAGIPYVGAGVASSAVGMDKIMMKALFAQNNLPIAPFTWISRNRWNHEPNGCLEWIEGQILYPYFVKPSCLGSSVGISKVHNRKELESALNDAARYDPRIVIEQGLSAREIECSVLGNDQPQASLPGEIIPKREFYDYTAKYLEDTTELHVPARLNPEQVAEIQKLAIRAFQAIGCSGMGRVDLFLEKESGRFYLNEINTIPGFTSISMYPKLWEVSGISFAELLDRLIELGLERFQDQSRNVTSYEA